MNATSQGTRPGPSLGGSLRLFGYVAALVIGSGTPTAFGALQALWSPDPLVRLGLVVAWSTRGPLLVLAAPVLGLVPELVLIASAVLGAVLLASHLTRPAPPPAAPAAVDAGLATEVPRKPEPQPAVLPLVVVGAVTGTLGRAWFDGRSWTVRSTERLRNGEVYVVLRRDEDVLEVGACP